MSQDAPFATAHPLPKSLCTKNCPFQELNPSNVYPADSGPCVGWECLKISCKVIHGPCGDLWLRLRTVVVLSICGVFLLGSFFSPH